MKIRIAVAVLPNGQWNSCGWGGPNNTASDADKIMFAREPLEEGETICWIEADVPVPEIKTIIGEVITNP